jgi:hypothetical protein
MRFTKIKWNTKELLLEWTTERGGETHGHELTSKGTPHPDFVEALKALKDDVIEIAELPLSYAHGLRVQSVTMSRSEKTGVEGAVITGLKSLTSATSPLVLNTPYLVNDPQAETGAMTSGMAERLETLRFEAERYIEGKRAQGELFPPSAAEERANADAGAGETTMSLNGGPQVPLSAVRDALDIVKGRRGRPGSDQRLMTALSETVLPDAAIEAAAQWWATVIKTPKFDALGGHRDENMEFAQVLMMVGNRRAPAIDTERFRLALIERIRAAHPYDRRIISVDYGPCGILADAAESAGIKDTSFTFPIKTMMWLDPDRVRVSYGYAAPVVVIWPPERAGEMGE